MCEGTLLIGAVLVAVINQSLDRHLNDNENGVLIEMNIEVGVLIDEYLRM